ncbi:eukaryotic cytochrome b561 domain protein [Metarhizium robertsii]|uniref:Cellobiose dehydrogenase n=2 Tax=Metarhizium robertsii TaxID=568076 RepID=E9ESB8_METRA|nr:cellobiose dehydrogenase [Metarhizium robertsii ARSEF 23]EFZ01635.1 cellobiose dehydrogenase [Metarhizium robertsii ARSEF 23]EXV01478.1 eukaryotic cytochrome b561 domain protein [Metarhizium robertsii]
MLPKSLWRAAFLACAALTPAIRADGANPPGQSTFISPGNNVAFAFTVPNDNDNPRSTFFSIRVPKKYTWGGVGLGSDDMKGALFLIIYQNGDGTNVTFSPRIAHGNYEPFFFRDMRWTVIPNQTGIIDDYMIFTAMCTESCRTWPGGDTTGGYIDVSSPAQPAIYAVGPEGTLRDDSPSAGLRYHHEYGVFNIDMRRTRGAADAPVLGKHTRLDGAVQVSSVTTKGDLKTTLHAAFMIFSIIGLMGFGGILLLPAVGLAKWHALNQIVATMGVLGGLFLGVLASFNYQRSRSFKHHHQVLGYIIVAFILAQLGLGVQHHFKHQRTKAPTIFGKIHVWLGRLILLLAAVNGVIGFTFALKGTSAIVFGVFVCVFTVAAVLLRLWYFPIKSHKFQPVGAQQSHTWRQSSGYNAGYSSRHPPGYEPPSQQIGLQATRSSSENSPWKSGDNKDGEDDEPQLGNAQRPREFA